MKNIEISGPFFKFSSPYGDRTTLHRDEWFVSRKLTKRQLASPKCSKISRILGEHCLGNIIKFKNRSDYVISQLFPRTAFNSLDKAVQFLVENEGKLVFCS